MPDDETSETHSAQSNSSVSSSKEQEVQEERKGPPASTAEQSMDAPFSSSFLRGVRAPISDDAPAGEPILYDEDFRTLKTEIDAIGSASGTADYEVIVELGRS